MMIEELTVLTAMMAYHNANERFIRGMSDEQAKLHHDAWRNGCYRMNWYMALLIDKYGYGAFMKMMEAADSKIEGT